MCSIMGYLGKRIPLDLLVDGFYKTISRGPDLSRMLSVGDGYLMFHRLTIMGLEKSGMQPFERNGDAVRIVFSRTSVNEPLPAPCAVLGATGSGGQ